MEEILASIRRIIEDSEPGATKPQEDEASAEAPHGPTAEGAVIEVEAFREGLGRAEADQPEPAATEAPEVKAEARPSMANIQASLREVDEETAHAAPEIMAARPAAPAEAPAVQMAGDTAAAAPSIDTGRADAAPAEPATAEGQGELRPSIISEQAGRQVAAAFGELSEVFAASRRRSFDEMAEEMIRPMLREWMDNNLPVLVERLVREEIERVARGA